MHENQTFIYFTKSCYFDFFLIKSTKDQLSRKIALNTARSAFANFLLSYETLFIPTLRATLSKSFFQNQLYYLILIFNIVKQHFAGFFLHLKFTKP